jgi:CHAD domain-containing protein
MSFQIHFAEPLSAELTRVITEQIDTALFCLDNVTGDTSPEAIHEFRKTTKKLRALIRLLRSALPKSVSKPWLTSLCSASACLSMNRDALVLEQNLARAYPILLPDVATLDQPWRKLSLFGPYQDSVSMAPESASVQTARAEILTLKAQLEVGLFATVTIPELLKAQSRCYRRARRVLSKLRSPVPIDALHRFRKRSKDNLYQLRLLIRLSPKRIRHEVSQLEKLTSILGELNDLSLLLQAHDKAHSQGGEVVELPGLRDWVLKSIAELEHRALTLAEPFYAQSPKKRHQALLACQRKLLRSQRLARKTHSTVYT